MQGCNPNSQIVLRFASVKLYSATFKSVRFAFSDEISSVIPSLVARAGDVNPTYSTGSSKYGSPQLNPATGKPFSLNEAEFEGLQRLRDLEKNNPAEYNRILLEMEQRVRRGY